MLIFWVAAVLSDQSSPRQILLELSKLIFILSLQQFEPSAGNQGGETIPLSLVGFDVSWFLDKYRYIFR